MTVTDPALDVVVLTIIHGDVETEAEARSLEAVRHIADPWLVGIRGTNDTTALHLRRAGVTNVMRAVRVHRRSWWKVTITTDRL